MALEKVFTVSEYLDYLNEIFKVDAGVQVSGEVSSWKVYPSGIFFSLKDKTNESVMDCYIHPFEYRVLGIKVEEGMDVKVTGAGYLYKPKGRFSFRAERIELVGEGSLKKAYEALKKKLESEGLFERKKPIPQFISAIGVITSRSGAVIHDFRKNLLPLGLEIRLRDTRVEGAEAIPGIINGIKFFNREENRPDVLVIIRGGGSLEDLQAFNNELVAREIFASKAPVICGIGHDKDEPIANLVADLAVSTPSIAALAINKSWDPLREKLPILERELFYAFEGNIISIAERIRRSAEKMIGGVRNIFTRSRIVAEKLERLFENSLRVASDRLSRAEAYLVDQDPRRNLALGYSIVVGAGGKVVKSLNDIKLGENVLTRVTDGVFSAKVEKITKLNRSCKRAGLSFQTKF